MRLKRGVTRESCDFCHRRKIRCDRASRAAQGHQTCSQCDLRQAPCTVDDSDDIRLRRRRQAGNARSNTPSVQARSGSQPHSIAASSPGHPHLQQFPSLEAPPLFQGEQQQQQISPFIPEEQQSFDAFEQNNLFDLTNESIWFLDQIFMGDFASSTGWGNQPILLDPMTGQTQSATDPSTGISHEASDEHEDSPSPFVLDLSTARDLWSSCNVDSTTFIAALHAYFDFAALCLPIIFEDAFWTDYGADRCSDSLVYALACRGMPFTQDVDKWATQQRLARRFKETYLERQQSSTTTGGSIQLDIVEALALMVGFQYEPGYESSAYSHLEALFLSHDSLVMMTLQCRLQQDTSTDTPQLSRAVERRTLLFWHVYGLDAFHSLDHKSVSRIPDEDGESTRVMQQHDSGGYLDAILSLAIIARRIFQKLCCTSARRKGICPDDVDALYEDLETWQQTCPSQLQPSASLDGGTQMMKRSSSTPHLTLQCAVLWALRINCYMQIESCVNEYGIMSTDDAMQGRMVCAQVEHESLRAVQEGLKMLEWIEADHRTDAQKDTYSLIDLSPTIIRDICAGLCAWTCIRGKANLSHAGTLRTPYRVHSKAARASSQGDDLDGSRADSRSYLQSARRFHSAVATAVSHKDTGLVLHRIGNFITQLEQELE